MKRIALILFLSSMNHPAIANPDIDAAFGLCSILENANISTDCDVSGWSKAISVRMDAAGSEARQICSILVQKYGNEFTPGWSLKILNPYSGENAVATCRLN